MHPRCTLAVLVLSSGTPESTDLPCFFLLLSHTLHLLICLTSCAVPGTRFLLQLTGQSQTSLRAAVERQYSSFLPCILCCIRGPRDDLRTRAPTAEVLSNAGHVSGGLELGRHSNRLWKSNGPVDGCTQHTQAAAN